MDDIKAKQEVVEKIKNSSNILVTVSRDPSVDALSAAIGLNLLLDKLDKHATTIFSGTVPPAIAFLEPEKILDDTTDSLRDFIIALDKEKADHLRYKVEGDSVKIFITPYKTTITSDDLSFSQGDYNVELVIALGVDNQDHLDNALEDHGQILHDAAIITMTAGDQTSTLGGIDWHDTQASSLSEMVAGLAEALKTDKNKSLLDNESSTALLTGIVAQTDRFSNEHTTSRVMTVASQLMASGADQQLIASKLEEDTAESNDDNALKVDESVADDTKEASKDSLTITHKPFETLEEMDKRVKAAEQAEAAEAATDILKDETKKDDELAPTGNETAAGAYAVSDEKPLESVEPAEPSMGGTLNATTDQAAEDARHDEENDQNKTILSHSYVQSSPAYETPISSTESTSSAGFVLGADRPQVGDAATPPTPPAPADLGLPMPPPLPDFNAPTVLSPAYAPEAAAPQPEILGDILAQPEAQAQPQAPIAPLEPSAPAPEAPQTPPASNSASNPGQFQIPPQQ